MSLINSFFIRLHSTKVGEDNFLNKYYLSNSMDYLGRFKRYVLYKGIEEPSKVPPMWHAWLHYMMDEIPNNVQNFSWQQQHTPNLTGTKLSTTNIKKEKSLSVYNKWQPFNKSN